MKFNINAGCGHIELGPLLLSWGNADKEFDLPPFLVLGMGDYSLEFGDIDQGAPGIYLTRWIDEEPVTVHTFWRKD